MYNPPSKDNWVMVAGFMPCYAEAYDAGYAAARAGLPESANPHKPSGHERDLSWDDEMHYWWYSGWMDHEA